MLKRKILFVEDDRFWARSYIAELQSAGFEVVYARNAGDAVKLIEDVLDFDAVILDVMMPTPEGVPDSTTEEGLSTGLWVLECIQQYLVPRRIAVWILTNRSLPTITERVEAMPAAVRELIVANRKNEVSSMLVPPYLRGMIDRNRQ
jgi:CheY-like chemotaxis protein